jgi:hypothetical protein
MAIYEILDYAFPRKVIGNDKKEVATSQGSFLLIII